VETAFPGLDHTRIELLHALGRPGGVRPDELVILSALVRHLQPRRLVEIGTAEGRTTLNLVHHAPADAEVITLDLPPSAPDATLESGKDYRQMGIESPGSLIRDHPLATRIRPILADSTRFDWGPYARSVDFAFIDGDHSYEGVRQDSENLLGAMRDGGVLLWHDYGVADGVTRHLNELARQWPVVVLAGTSLACLRLEAGEGVAPTLAG
jgi:predicted O-methyltransferase YrrM